MSLFCFRIRNELIKTNELLKEFIQLTKTVVKQKKGISEGVILKLIKVGDKDKTVCRVAHLVGIDTNRFEWYKSVQKIIDDVPCIIKENISLKYAEAAKTELESFGCKVEIIGGDQNTSC